jgi:hypothetical protein
MAKDFFSFCEKGFAAKPFRMDENAAMHMPLRFSMGNLEKRNHHENLKCRIALLNL